MWTKLFSSLLFIGVAAGAFGAHGLKDRLSEGSLAIWHTATLYLFIHALAGLFLSIISTLNVELQLKASATIVCFFVGILIFSGSLYALAISDIKILGAITPIGGVLFLVGWVLLVVRL